MAELFHGPTLAFKDLALTFVGQLYNYFLEKSQKHYTIVVGNTFQKNLALNVFSL